MILQKAIPRQDQHRATARLTSRFGPLLDDLSTLIGGSQEDFTAGLATVRQAADAIRDVTARLSPATTTAGVAWRVLPVGRIELTSETRVYPLRGIIRVLVKTGPDFVEAHVGELDAVAPLRGTGKDAGEALQSLFWEFHRLVEAHWWVPPHARSEEDGPIRRVLEHLIDWHRFAAENPVEQPLWGRILALTGGAALVHWFIGPDGDRGEYDGAISGTDVHPAMRTLQVGEWFLGSARCYPNRLVWTASPEPVPDPRDPAARQAAWDRIPVVVTDDTSAWPTAGGG